MRGAGPSLGRIERMLIMSETNLMNAVAAMNQKARRKAATPETIPAKAPKAEGKSPKAPRLTPSQKAAEAAVIKAAQAVDQGLRGAVAAVAEADRMGLPKAYGLTLPEWVGEVLGKAGIARSTVYYLKDAGLAAAAIGADRAALFPTEGLRLMAAKGKRDAVRIVAMADAAQGGNPKATPSLKGIRAVAGATDAPMSQDAKVALVAKAAMAAAGDDHEVAKALLVAAAKRIDALKAAKDRAEAEAVKAAK